jgi:hypothetical protein
MANNSEEGQGSQRAVVPLMMMSFKNELRYLLLVTVIHCKNIKCAWNLLDLHCSFTITLLNMSQIILAISRFSRNVVNHGKGMSHFPLKNEFPVIYF